MQKINLQISNTVSAKLDLHNTSSNPVTIDIKTSNKELEQARENGGKVIWGASNIENMIENIVTNYLFGPGYGINHKRDFFSNEIITTKYVSYDAKKHLIKRIVIQELFLDKEKRKELTQLLNKIIKYRNAFAHGDLLHDHDAGCILKFYSGGHDEYQLDGKFWDKLELDFKTANDLLEKIQKDIGSRYCKELKKTAPISIKETMSSVKPKESEKQV